MERRTQDTRGLVPESHHIARWVARVVTMACLIIAVCPRLAPWT